MINDAVLTSPILPRGWRLIDRDRGVVVAAGELSWWEELEQQWRQTSEAPVPAEEEGKP
jgi:hypothetical protein